MHRQVIPSPYYTEVNGTPHFVATPSYLCHCRECGAVVAVPYRQLLKPAHLAPYSCGCVPMPPKLKARLLATYHPSQKVARRRRYYRDRWKRLKRAAKRAARAAKHAKSTAQPG